MELKTLSQLQPVRYERSFTNILIEGFFFHSNYLDSIYLVGHPNHLQLVLNLFFLHLQVSLLSSNKPCCHWFTATPNPLLSVFKPFVFTPNVRISLHTRSPAPNESVRCIPIYISCVKQKVHLIIYKYLLLDV